MKNVMKNKKLNDKGFSLVELIIVIAIMAVLIGVLAPQYVKYVEKSRNSTDQDNAAAIESAMQVWGSETSATNLFVADSTGTKITVNSAGLTVDTSGANKAAVSDALANAGISTTTKCVSKSAWNQYVITVKVDTTGVVTTKVDYSTATTTTP